MKKRRVRRIVWVPYGTRLRLKPKHRLVPVVQSKPNRTADPKAHHTPEADPSPVTPSGPLAHFDTDCNPYMGFLQSLRYHLDAMPEETFRFENDRESVSGADVPGVEAMAHAPRSDKPVSVLPTPNLARRTGIVSCLLATNH